MFRILGIFLVATLFCSFRGMASAQVIEANPIVKEGSRTEWGWPLPYEQVSQKSLDWLKAKGWLPLTIGYFADVPGYSAVYAIIKEKKLLEKRGLPVNFISFLSGPPIVEAFISGQTQVSHYGDFPFWSTVDKGVPCTAFGLTGVNQEIAMLVRLDSPFKNIDDIKNAKKKPVIIGTTLGSYAEFYLSAMAKVKGLKYGKDYQIAGMSMRDAQLLPQGVDAVALWDPHIEFALSKNLGRKIDSGYPYFFATAYDFIRQEIHENAPDVVQTLADVAIEAVLYARYNLEEAVDAFLKDPRAAAYPRELFKRQIQTYVTYYPPTYRYLHKDFWAKEDARIAESQFEKGRMEHKFSEEDLKKHFAPGYMENTFKKLGIEIPQIPVFLPKGWQGKVGYPPYPKYYNKKTFNEP